MKVLREMFEESFLARNSDNFIYVNQRLMKLAGDKWSDNLKIIYEEDGTIKPLKTLIELALA